MRVIGRSTVIVVLALAGVEPGDAQAVPPAGVTVSVYTGGVAFSDWQGVWVAAADGAVADGSSMRVRGALAPSPAAVVGISLSRWSRRGWGVRLEGAYAPSRLELRVDGPLSVGVDPQEAPHGAPAFGDVDVWTVSGLGLFRLPIALGRILPYGRAGVGVIGDRVTNLVEAEAPSPLQRRGTRIGADIGLGARVPLNSSNLGLYFEISDLFSRTPIGAATEGELLRSNSLVIEGAPSSDSADTPARVHLANQLRIVAGLSLRLFRD